MPVQFAAPEIEPTFPIAVASQGTTVPLPPAEAEVGQPPLPLPPAQTQVELRPAETPVVASTWTAGQEEALAELIGITVFRQEWLSSAEITQVLSQPGRARAISSAEREVAANLPVGERGEVSSPVGGELPHEKGFWFNVNAELVVYGATEPNATVSIGGRQIRLRPDGTFSYRFALPDGRYFLPVSAVSAHGDTRRAELSFERGTFYSGGVGVHPHDPALKLPQPENIS